VTTLTDVAAPVQRDQELELTIESLAYGGNGVARLDGFVVFVRRGLPGDTVKARVTKVQRRHAEALATEVVTAGHLRVDAPCAHYPACGGCRFQDLAYEAQVQTKHQWVADSLQRLAGLADAPLEPIVPAKSQFHYRNKMEYSFAQTEEGPTLGLHVAGRWDTVLEIERCWLTSDLGNRIRNTVRDWARVDGERPAAHRFAARIYEDMGAVDLAEEAADRAAQRGPTDASAWERLGRLRLRLLDREGALEALRRAMALGAGGEVRELIVQALALEPSIAG